MARLRLSTQVRRWRCWRYRPGSWPPAEESGGSGAASTPAAKSACQQVGAALADGPDSGADPVGYALAQILPLRAIRISSDPTLHAAIDGLASAYQTYYSHNGSGGAVDAPSTRPPRRSTLSVPGPERGYSDDSSCAAMGKCGRRCGAGRRAADGRRRRRVGVGPVHHPLQRPARADHRGAGRRVREEDRASRSTPATTTRTCFADQIVAEGSHSPADVFFTENSPPLEYLAPRGCWRRSTRRPWPTRRPGTTRPTGSGSGSRPGSA